MAYPKHAEEAAEKRRTVTTKEFTGALGSAATEAAMMFPVLRALRAARRVLGVAKKVGNAKKVAKASNSVVKLEEKLKRIERMHKKRPIASADPKLNEMTVKLGKRARSVPEDEVVRIWPKGKTRTLMRKAAKARAGKK